MDDQKKDDPDPERSPKKNHPQNYRPIKCLPTMFKILRAQI